MHVTEETLNTLITLSNMRSFDEVSNNQRSVLLDDDGNVRTNAVHHLVGRPDSSSQQPRCDAGLENQYFLSAIDLQVDS